MFNPVQMSGVLCFAGFIWGSKVIEMRCKVRCDMRVARLSDSVKLNNARNYGSLIYLDWYVVAYAPTG